MELFLPLRIGGVSVHFTIGRDPVADSKAVAQYLPFLRRYARALTGSQHSGDAYVAATLEAMLADPSVIDGPGGSGGPRVALYRLFTKIWNSIALNEPLGTVPAALPG